MAFLFSMGLWQDRNAIIVTPNLIGINVHLLIVCVDKCQTHILRTQIHHHRPMPDILLLFHFRLLSSEYGMIKNLLSLIMLLLLKHVTQSLLKNFKSINDSNQNWGTYGTVLADFWTKPSVERVSKLVVHNHELCITFFFSMDINKKWRAKKKLFKFKLIFIRPNRNNRNFS